MHRTPTLLLLLGPALLLVGGCQVIASLTVPTYSSATSGAGGAGGSSSGTGGATTTGVGGGLATGQGGACTASPDLTTIPPCLEHLQLWLVGDRNDLITTDAGDLVTAWQDASSFGWTASAPPGTVTWVQHANGQHAVRIANGGMKLDAHGKALDLTELGVFGAFNFVAFPPANDPVKYPFGSSNILCLRTVYAKPKLAFGLTSTMVGPRFETSIHDGADQNLITVTEPGPALDRWDIYGAQYSCDAACAGSMMGAKREGFVNDDDGINNDSQTPSLDPEKFKVAWNGVWDSATLGSFCDDPSRGQINADVGELLVYDSYLEPTMRDDVHIYLRKRWVH